MTSNFFGSFTWIASSVKTLDPVRISPAYSLLSGALFSPRDSQNKFAGLPATVV